MTKIYAILILIAAVFSGCMDDDALWNIGEAVLPTHSQGVFIANEGNFMYGNASLSYYDIEESTVYNDVFFQANALPLGDVAHSILIRDELGYVVVNNSGRVYVFDINTFELKGKITGLTSPRYMHFVNDQKAYITDLYARSIAVVNPETLELHGAINVNNPEGGFYQHSTEQMVQYGSYVFVACWSYDSHILVIDSERDEWIETLEVMPQPNSMVLDKYGKLWVLSDGGFPGSPYLFDKAALMRIDALSRETEHVFYFEPGDRPLSLSINAAGDTLYFINHHVYRHPVTGSDSPGVFLASPYETGHYGGFSAIGIDPVTSEIYVADALDYVQPGLVYRFTPEAEPVDTFRVGIIPGAFAFK
ncbi:MAG: YncE family protein [Bacteroidales bacterium]|nr:YncE family protein [Bacteroidales bacterium]